MHTLDKLAAIAIILQFIVILIFGFLFLSKFNNVQGRLVYIEARLSAKPTNTPVEVSTAPLPATSLTKGFVRGASPSATPRFRSIK